jgi:vancomycin resistance protein YoaR
VDSPKRTRLELLRRVAKTVGTHAAAIGSRAVVLGGAAGRKLGPSVTRAAKAAIFPIDRAKIVRVGTVALFGPAIALVLMHKPAAEKRVPPPDPNPPEVRIFGKALPMKGSENDTLEAARAIARAYVNESVTLEVPAFGARAAVPERRTRGDLGARVDSARLASLVADVRDRESALRRGHEAVAKGKPIDLPMPVVTDEKRAFYSMMDVKGSLDKSPVDARLDLVHRHVLPDEAGRRMDLYATLAKLDQAIARGDTKITAVVDNLPAGRASDAIKNVVIDDVLGYFETKYAKDLKHEARTFNLRLAASKLDGHVIMPGETFDFNEAVGPRNEAMGYRVAPVIASGELVDGIGGGTCQIAGTLHGAAYFAGLDIVERKPHTRPSFYIKMGMDATVVYPTITLKLKNPFTFPVVLHEVVEDGMVHAEILGPKRTRDVTFVRKINEVVPFQEREVTDANVPKGERMLAQRGIPGFKITRYRILRDGSFAVRERTQDVYPPTQQIWKVGSGEADDKFVAHDDEHPEYVADEYLQISQGPDVHDPHGHTSPPGGATVESRVAGKYGTHGWTVKEGFAKALKGSHTSARMDFNGGGDGEGDKPGTD